MKRVISFDIAIAQGHRANPRWVPEQAAQQRLPAQWGDVVGCHAACVLRQQASQRVEAYSQLQSAVQPFLKVRGHRVL